MLERADSPTEGAGTGNLKGMKRCDGTRTGECLLYEDRSCSLVHPWCGLDLECVCGGGGTWTGGIEVIRVFHALLTVGKVCVAA